MSRGDVGSAAKAVVGTKIPRRRLHAGSSPAPGTSYAIAFAGAIELAMRSIAFFKFSIDVAKLMRR